MARKFNKRAFKEFLDCVAAAVIKTRDDFTCQIRHETECLGTMMPLDMACHCCHIEPRKSNNTRWDMLNLITGCKLCHGWADTHPAKFIMWFAAKYPHRVKYLASLDDTTKTWRESDFRFWEEVLIKKAIDLNVDYLHINTKHRSRFKRRFEELITSNPQY
jgi:hypothetical protein